MANYVIIRHSVRDFSEWKTGYDEHEPVRAAAKLTEKHVLQDADDPNMVTLIFEAEDLKHAEEFSSSISGNSLSVPGREPPQAIRQLIRQRDD